MGMGRQPYFQKKIFCSCFWRHLVGVNKQSTERKKMKNTTEQALEIGKKIQEKIEQKNWNQSDLARAANMGRDSISTYVRGLVMPETKNLKRLADALECSVSDLSPYKTIKIDNGQIFEIKEADNGNFLIKINRRVTANQAAAIFDALRQ